VTLRRRSVRIVGALFCRRPTLEGGTKRLVNLSRIDSPRMRAAMSLGATPAAISTRGTADRLRKEWRNASRRSPRHRSRCFRPSDVIRTLSSTMVPWFWLRTRATERVERSNSSWGGSRACSGLSFQESSSLVPAAPPVIQRRIAERCSPSRVRCAAA